MSGTGSLRRTPLYDRHVAAGAKLVDFAGWEMPVQYAGVMDEHRAVRTNVGIFDVSHMGEFRVRGSAEGEPGAAEAFVQSFTPNDVSKLTPGRAHYSALLTPEGTFVDDLLVYRIAADEFLIVVNAGGIDVDFAWISALPRPAGVTLENRSDDYALLAVQGPKAAELVQRFTDTNLSEIKYYRFALGQVDGREAILSRTGYTGEDGFELYVAPSDAGPLWDLLVGAGARPAGLGARDTLRLEAGMALYGHEIDRETTPWDANLDWIVKMEKGDFLGHSALAAAKAAGPKKKLVGFEVEGRGIARQGHKVMSGGADGREIGVVTSGTYAPTLEKAIGMAHVEAASSAIGTPLEIDVRGKPVAARVVALPFYKRAK
jgi:aminomethyltransferase